MLVVGSEIKPKQQKHTRKQEWRYNNENKGKVMLLKNPKAKQIKEIKM